jgi:hypothetical protein
MHMIWDWRDFFTSRWTEEHLIRPGQGLGSGADMRSLAASGRPSVPEQLWQLLADRRRCAAGRLSTSVC